MCLSALLPVLFVVGGEEEGEEEEEEEEEERTEARLLSVTYRLACCRQPIQELIRRNRRNPLHLPLPPPPHPPPFTLPPLPRTLTVEHVSTGAIFPHFSGPFICLFLFDFCSSCAVTARPTTWQRGNVAKILPTIHSVTAISVRSYRINCKMKWEMKWKMTGQLIRDGGNFRKDPASNSDWIPSMSELTNVGGGKHQHTSLITQPEG